MVPLHGNRLARWLLRLFGWQVVFEGLPSRQGVVVIYPHTSNWDFVVLVLAKWAVGLPATFWGKDTLFRIPLFGRWLRWIGGLPVIRNAPQGVVGQAVAALKNAKEKGEILWWALSPEGTRRLTPGWRSGFYQAALGADVPVGLVRVDFGLKEVRVVDFVRLTGDRQADMDRIRAALVGVVAYRPAWMSPITLNNSGVQHGQQ
jgi:1-acyl-sn-glycerol-3-phosphate acyltransferase